MVNLRGAKIIYATGILAMPLSYGLRDLLGLNFTWINPTLILAFIVSAVFLKFKTPDKRALLIVIYACIAALFGSFLIDPSPDRGKSALYIICMEPARLALNILWYFASIYFLRNFRGQVLRWLVVSVSIQMAIAAYLYLALYDLVFVPDPLKLFLAIYRERQVVWIGNFQLYRMAGTFFESPPFSLFMFCCFVVFVLAWIEPVSGVKKKWIVTGAVLSMAGAILAFSDQVLLALPIFGLCILSRMSKKAGVVYGWAATVVFAVVSVGAIAFFNQKLEMSNVVGKDIYANSIAERSFHVKYGMDILLAEPSSLVLGIGPGRYGDYAGKTQIFPSTVTLQVTPIEWLVEYGALGSLIIAWWLFGIGERSFAAFRGIGVVALCGLLLANMFQANWKWEAWFFALAFLYTSADNTGRFEDRLHSVQVGIEPGQHSSSAPLSFLISDSGREASRISEWDFSGDRCWH